MAAVERRRFVDIVRLAAVTLSAVALSLTASCAASSSYTGLSLMAPDLPTGLRALAARAQSGDKQAQLELGIAFEEGHGVAQDREQALRLYRQAASDSGGPTWVYVPPVVAGQAGRVMQVGTGLAQKGLPAAKLRLERLTTAPTTVRPSDPASN